MFDEQPRDATGVGPETGATVAATAKTPRRKAKRTRKGTKLPITQGFLKIAFALLATATLLVAAWFGGFHLMVATLAPHAPALPGVTTSALTSSSIAGATVWTNAAPPGVGPAGQVSNPAGYPLALGHVTLSDLVDFSSSGVQNADTPTYRAHASGKVYYDWYTQWYNVLAVGFLTSIAAYFVGEAINNAVTTRLQDAPGKASAASPEAASDEDNVADASPLKSAPEGILTVHNFLGIVSISLGAIAALGVFIVNEHYRLLEPVHADLPFRMLGPGAITHERWVAQPNIVRGIYDTVMSNDAGRNGYFPALYATLAVTCALPLLAGGSAIEAFRLTAALLGKAPGKAVQLVRDFLDGLKAQKAQAQADLDRLNQSALTDQEALRLIAAELAECLATEAEAARTQGLKVEQLKRCRDFAKVLSEYLEDLALKRNHLLDKRSDVETPDALDRAPVDKALEAALDALDRSMEELKAAHLSVLHDIDRLESELSAQSLALKACRERMAHLRPQAEALETRLALTRSETARLEGRLNGLDDDIATQDQVVRDLTNPSAPANGVLVETWRGNRVLTLQQVDGRRATLSARFYGLLILAGLLFLLGNLVTAPDLPASVQPAARGDAAAQVRILNWGFASLNLLIVIVWVALGLAMTWLTKRFFATKGASGWLRVASLAAATGLGIGFVAAVGNLPPGLRPQTPALPDRIGLAQLACTTGAAQRQDGSSDSAFLFAAGQTLTLDAKTQCTGIADPADANFYVVIGTASYEGDATPNEDLGNARALALSDSLAGAANAPKADKTISVASRKTPASTSQRVVYGLNLGAYQPDPKDVHDQSAIQAWQAVWAARTDDDRVSRTVEAMAASAYQRKVVVLQGFTRHGLRQDNVGEVLGEMLCNSGQLDKAAFKALSGLEAARYDRPIGCAGDRLSLLSRQDLQDRAAVATARREALEAGALLRELKPPRPLRRARMTLQGNKKDVTPIVPDTH